MSIDNDTVIHLAFQLCMFTYAFISIIKLIGSNMKLLINKLIIIVLIGYMIDSIIELVWDMFVLNEDDQGLSKTYNVTALFYANCFFSLFAIIPIFIIMDLRNRILMERKVLLSIRFLMLVTIVSIFIYLSISGIISPKNNNYKLQTFSSSSIFAIILGLFGVVFSVISNIHLLIYYYKYYFNSKSIMKHLKFQMVYRRNWIYIVTFLQIVIVFTSIPLSLNIYPYSFMAFERLIPLLELNIMIDFVTFDTVRNEITIDNYTMYMFEGDSYY